MQKTAFFDLDYTLLNTSSGLMYVKEIIKARRIPWWVIVDVGVRYQLKRLDFGQAHTRLIGYVGQHGQTEAAKFFADWVPRLLFPLLSESGRAKIAWHHQQGHRVVIISASIAEIVQPVAEHLDLGADYLCTYLEVEQGRYTGRLAGPLCYGAGKVTLAQQWAKKNNLPFPETVGYFYTDSSSDLPLLELADHPIAVNPSRKLAKIAQARGWSIETFG